MPSPARSQPRGREEPGPKRWRCCVPLEPALSKEPRQSSGTMSGIRLCCGMLNPVSTDCRLEVSNRTLVQRERLVELGLEQMAKA